MSSCSGRLPLCKFSLSQTNCLYVLLNIYLLKNFEGFLPFFFFSEGEGSQGLLYAYATGTIHGQDPMYPSYLDQGFEVGLKSLLLAIKAQALCFSLRSM